MKQVDARTQSQGSDTIKCVLSPKPVSKLKQVRGIEPVLLQVYGVLGVIAAHARVAAVGS